MNTELKRELINALGGESVKENVSLKEYTTFRTGGRAELFIEPDSSLSAAKAVEILGGLDQAYLILGNGSNVLVADEGVSCPVIHIGKKMSRITVFENCITAQSGAALSAVARTAMEHSLAGLEFASGIPGNVGGGVIMNAGAYGGELKDVVEAVCFIGPDGKEYTADNAEMEFGYRKSALSGGNCIVTAVSFLLRKGNKDEIAEKMKELNRRRRDKQPLEYPSVGSTFKRPEGYFAGALIEGAGLKGFSVGGAAVSEKHAGFVINKASASSADILALIEHIQKTVYQKDGVMLEPEVKIWGISK